VLTCVGRDPLGKVRLAGPKGGVTRGYDETARGSVVTLSGGATVNLTLPGRDADGPLALQQPYLVLQLLLAPGAPFALHLAIVDSCGARRRIQLSTATREVVSHPLHARVPLTVVRRGTWLNLCIDLRSVVSGCFPGQGFRSLDAITVTPVCKLRRIFTLRAAPVDTTDDADVLGLHVREGEEKKKKKKKKNAPFSPIAHTPTHKHTHTHTHSF
jgi:hypothetical protein